MNGDPRFAVRGGVQLHGGLEPDAHGAEGGPV